MRDTFARVLNEIAMRDERVVVLAADISPVGKMHEFVAEHPDRFINVGVAEQSMVGIAAGLAITGKIPFCYTIATFALYRPFEFIRNDLGYQNLPVTIVGMGAGLTYASLGATHYAQEDIAIARSVPNMEVWAPADPSSVEQTIIHIMNRKTTGPVYLRLGKSGEPELDATLIGNYSDGGFREYFGLPDKSPDAVVFTYGTISGEAIAAAKLLAKHQINLLVVIIGRLKPVNNNMVAKYLSMSKLVLTFEEHVPDGGVSSVVANCIALGNEGKNFKPITIPDSFEHFYGSHQELLAFHKLTSQRIYEIVLSEHSL
jgi:transketolase